MKDLKILIMQQRGWALTIGHHLAKKLQAEGCRLAALTLKRSTHRFVKEQTEVKYDLIINNDEIMESPKDYLDGDVYSLEEICRELNLDTIWPIVATLRGHVRSYRDKYYYGFKQNVSDEDILDYVYALYKYINYIFERFNPDLIIGPNFVSIPQIMLNLFASKRNVEFLAVTDSKVQNYFIFVYNHVEDTGPFFDRLDLLNKEKAESINRERAKRYIREFRESFKYQDYTLMRIEGNKTLLKKIKKVIMPYYQIVRFCLKENPNFLKSIGISIDYRPPRIVLRDHYCSKRYRKSMDNFKYYPLEKVGKYVYYPLLHQPEASIDVISPYFNNQIETGRLIAQSLPDDYTLVVKEHPRMVGLRPPSYIEKVARTPNVKLVDYRITTEEVLKGANLVISQNSTTLAESAFYWKPAIQLGNLGSTLQMPNVFKHTDMTTLAKKIRELLKVDLKTQEYEQRLENYVVAAYDTGHNLNYWEIWEQGAREEEWEHLWEIYKKEIIRAAGDKRVHEA